MHRILILIVDDTAINLMSTALTVRSIGYTVQEAASGEEALLELKRRSYSAILMDLQMPKMSGLTCTKKIRAFETGTNRRIPIIAFTSQAESDIGQECLDAGMDGFLDKACSFDKLAKTLKQFVPAVAV